MQPILDGLANNLDDSLCLTLELAKSEQEKANKYTEDLLQYTRRFKGHAPHFNTIVTALAAKAINALPGPLQEVGNAMLPIIKKHGVPEKAYAKFADKLHFLISALAAAASTQLVKNQSGSGMQMDRGASAPASNAGASGVEMKSNPYSAVAAADAVNEEYAAKHDSSLLSGTAAELSDSNSSEKLKAILEENIDESDEDFTAMLLGSRGVPYTLVFGLWLEKKPHLLTVTFFGVTPASMRVTTAPSTDFILQLQKDPQRVKRKLGEVRQECRAVPGALHKRLNHSVVETGLIPYIGFPCACAVTYCNCMFTSLTMDKIQVGSQSYIVKMENKKISVNGNVVFEPKDLPVDIGAMCCSICCPWTMWPEFCC